MYSLYFPGIFLTHPNLKINEIMEISVRSLVRLVNGGRCRIVENNHRGLLSSLTTKSWKVFIVASRIVKVIKEVPQILDV